MYFLNSLVSSAFVAQKDYILHFACQSDDCWGSEALFKINSQHNAVHTDPLSLGQDYETEAEFDWATRLSSCGLELEHVCGAPLCCWSHALHFDKQMMHAELLQPVPLLDILRPSWVIIVDVMDVPEILKLPDHSSCTLSRWWSATMRVAWSLTVILSSNWITRHVRRGQQLPQNLHSIQIHA